MSSHRFSIVEPHPSVPSHQGFIATGRGGAGNAVKAPLRLTRGSDASGPASLASETMFSRKKSFISGRGGAGNHVMEAPRIFSFDEELQAQMNQTRNMAPVYHVGRGGAGNMHKHQTSNDAKLYRRDSNNSSVSTSSAESGADIATRNIKKGLKKFGSIF